MQTGPQISNSKVIAGVAREKQLAIMESKHALDTKAANPDIAMLRTLTSSSSEEATYRAVAASVERAIAYNERVIWKAALA